MDLQKVYLVMSIISLRYPVIISTTKIKGYPTFRQLQLRYSDFIFVAGFPASFDQIKSITGSEWWCGFVITNHGACWIPRKEGLQPLMIFHPIDYSIHLLSRY